MDMEMTLKEQFKHIINEENYETLLNFLKNLSPAERKSLSPQIDLVENERFEIVIKSVEEYRANHRDSAHGFWDTELGKLLHFKEKQVLLSKAICEPTNVIRPDLYPIFFEYGVFSWYFPSWLYEGANDFTFLNNYTLQLKCMQDSLRIPTDQQLAQSLAQFKFISIEKIPEQTLEKHIWLLFQNECNIHNHYEGGSAYWEKKIVELVELQLIDKQRVLRESLLTTSRFKNKAIPIYFFRILDKIAFTNNELIRCQEELFIVLSSQHSKPISQTLKYIKHIYKEPSFYPQGFIDQVPVLLSWEIKTVIDGTITLTDMIMSQYPESKKDLGLNMLQALSHTDEKLQIKTLKLLAKHRLLEDNEILDEIAIYADGLFQEAKQLLPSILLVSEPMSDEQKTIRPLPKTRKDNRIPTYEAFDELVFFFSQIFEGNNVYDLDLFFPNIMKIDTMITPQNIFKLDSTFQKALRLYTNWDHEKSRIYFIMACFFLEYASLLRDRYPEDAKQQNKTIDELSSFIAKLDQKRDDAYERTMRKEEVDFLGGPDMASDKMHTYSLEPEKLTEQERAIFEKRTSIVVFGDVETHLRELKNAKYYGHIAFFDFDNIESSATVCYLFANLCRTLLEHLKKEKTYAWLSAPTHLPTYIDSDTLVERFAWAQQHEAAIDPFDLQMALARWRFNADVFSRIENSLDKEIKLLLQYLVSNDKPLLLEDIQHPEYWLVAVLRKANNQEVQLFFNHFSDTKIDYEVLKAPDINATKEPWEYDVWERGEKAKKTALCPKLTLEKKNAIQSLQFDSIFKHQYVCMSYDISRLESSYGLLIAPELPHIFLQNLLVSISPEYNSNQTKKSLQILFSHFIDIWDNTHDSAYIFLAYMTVFEDVTMRTLSSELWIKTVAEGTMNNELLGQTLGKLEAGEYAPLKRFTDLVVSNMLGVSILHNKALETLLASMIPVMGDEPVKGTKKLLEIYLEVLAQNQSKAAAGVLEKLDKWKATKSLNPVIRKML